MQKSLQPALPVKLGGMWLIRSESAMDTSKAYRLSMPRERLSSGSPQQSRTMSSPSPLPPLPPHIEKLTAPLVIGELLGTYLFGILTVQLYLYHLNFPRDAPYIKLLVYSVFTIDLAATVMCFADAYHWFASGYGNLLALNDVWLSGFDTPMLGAWLAAIVQCFYAYRLWTINKYTLPVVIIVVGGALAQVIAGIYGAVLVRVRLRHYLCTTLSVLNKAHRAVTFAAAGPRVLNAAYVVNIGAAAVDVLIAITMTIILMRSRSNIHAHAHTKFIVKKIINLTVETNLLSSTLAVLTVILLVGVPGTNYFTAPSIMLGKIYSNSLLLMLNNRKYISNESTTTRSGGSDSRGGTFLQLSKFRAATRDAVRVDQEVNVSQSMDTSTVKSKGSELNVE
ncbi:hypothetical protein R3P38DRAFT_339649 [Favolaschia claudopus]|uniref:DUF6534 domain-containing protein n=1 Tax=Favolaschia claudopus TaxID=2862362 RepID=A0AAV9ZLA2_9AGAR